MTEHDTTRERMAEVIHDAIESIHGEVRMYDVDAEYPEWNGDIEITIPGLEHTAEKTTAAVIAHLWRRADDPEVQEAVAASMYNRGWKPGDPLMVWSELMPYQKNGWMKEGRAAITATLTALLGPRPTEQEAG